MPPPSVTADVPWQAWLFAAVITAAIAAAPNVLQWYVGRRKVRAEAEQAEVSADQSREASAVDLADKAIKLYVDRIVGPVVARAGELEQRVTEQDRQISRLTRALREQANYNTKDSRWHIEVKERSDSAGLTLPPAPFPPDLDAILFFQDNPLPEG